MSSKNGYREVETELSLSNIQAILETWPPFFWSVKDFNLDREVIAKFEFVKCEDGKITFRLGIKKEGEVQVIRSNGQKST